MVGYRSVLIVPLELLQELVVYRSVLIVPLAPTPPLLRQVNVQSAKLALLLSRKALRNALLATSKHRVVSFTLMRPA